MKNRSNGNHETLLGVKVGFAVVLVAEALAGGSLVGLVLKVHDPKHDLMRLASGELVPYAGVQPRIDALFIRARTPDEVQQSKINNLTLERTEHESEADVSVNRVVSVPHQSDVERFCLLSDGNLSNVANCPRYMVATKIEAV